MTAWLASAFSSRAVRLSPLFILGLTILCACQSTQTTTEFMTPHSDSPVRVESESPQSYYSYQDIEDEPVPDDLPYDGLVLSDANGALRKFYWLRPNRFKALQGLITEFTGIPANQIVSQPDWGEKGGAAGPGFDLMIVTGTEDQFLLVDDFLDSIEAQTPMIEIEAQVVELVNTDEFQLGVQTFITEVGKDGGNNPETLFRDINGVFDTEDFIQSELLGSTFQGFLMNLGTIHDEIGWDILIQALAEKRLANILSAPKITVLNGFKADIIIGEEVPIQTFKSVAGTALVDVTFKDAAVKLSVTPLIVGRDTVQMNIAPEVSRVTGFTNPGTRGLSNPIISTRNAKTTVNIRNGYTYVIGGLIGNTEIKNERKTPILGDIPILKHLFRTTSTTTTDTNLLFMIKPKIIYPEYYGEVSDRIFEPDVPLDEEFEEE